MTSELEIVKKVEEIEKNSLELKKKIFIKSIVPFLIISSFVILSIILIFNIIFSLIPNDIGFLRYFLSTLVAMFAFAGLIVFLDENKIAHFISPNLKILDSKLEEFNIQKSKEKDKLELYDQMKLNYWLNLKGIDLELATQSLFSRFLKVQLYLTPITGDGGIDVHGSGVIFQCKGNKTKVGEPAIRDFYGTARAHGNKTHRTIFVAPSGFTSSAIQFAKYKMKLIDSEILTNIAKGELDKISKNQ